MNVKLSQSSQERSNVLVGLPQLLFVLSVLAFVAAQLVSALDLDSFVLRDKLLDFRHEFDSFFLSHDDFIFVMGLHSSDLLLGLAERNSITTIVVILTITVVSTLGILSIDLVDSAGFLAHLIGLTSKICNLVFKIGVGYFELGDKLGALFSLFLCGN